MEETPVKFAWPWVLVAAAVVPLVLALLHRRSEAKAKQKLAGLIAPRLREQLLRSVDFSKRWEKVLIFAASIFALLVAIARPQLGFQTIEVERSSVDFIVALDLSRSMLAEDVDGKSRLQAGKSGIAAMLDQLGSDRAGLIAFAGEAFLAAPLTQDHETLKRNLAALDVRSIARQGSDLAKAIKLAVETFEAGKYETNALVLLSDGEELQGDAMIAAREAAAKGVRIFTVGVGSGIGARIPERKDTMGVARFAKNEFGRDVTTRLNERVLQQLAATGRGFYEPLGKDGAGLIATWRRGLEPLARGTLSKQSTDMQEYFQWPLAIAIGLLLWEMLVTDRRKQLDTRAK
jgi:Ca-activated chloride channel family protein